MIVSLQGCGRTAVATILLCFLAVASARSVLTAAHPDPLRLNNDDGYDHHLSSRSNLKQNQEWQEYGSLPRSPRAAILPLRRDGRYHHPHHDDSRDATSDSRHFVETRRYLEQLSELPPSTPGSRRRMHTGPASHPLRKSGGPMGRIRPAVQRRQPGIPVSVPSRPTHGGPKPQNPPGVIKTSNDAARKVDAGKTRQQLLDKGRQNTKGTV